jgi:transcriptional regulator with XRE-family HTH domain
MGVKVVNIRRKESRDYDFNRKLGQRLRELRYDHKYKLQDVQDMTGIRYDLLSQIENGWSRITVMELLGLCAIYEVTLDTMFEGLWEYLEVSD